jgi:TPP-dependent pyruvate/acetoin dehydrogenase alpha subunit
MYRQMLRIRAFDQQANELYLSAKMPGLTHMYIGQEAVVLAFARLYNPTTTLPTLIADMVIAWLREPDLI